MRFTKTAFTLFFLTLGLATANNSHVLRNYCDNHPQDFGHDTHKTLKQYFTRARQTIEQHKKEKKHSSDNYKREITSLLSMWDIQTKQLFKDFDGKSDSKATEFCNYLITLKNWLNNDQQCGVLTEMKNQVCTPSAGQIAWHFEGGSAGGRKGGKGDKGGKAGNHKVADPVINNLKTEQSNPKGKYAQMKKKNNFAQMEVPQEKKIEVIVNQNLNDVEDNSPKKVVGDAHEDEVKAEDTQSPAVEGNHIQFGEDKAEMKTPEVENQGVTHEAVKKVKRVIVVEVLACKDCVKDQFLQKYLETQNK